jgi:hypothetical protein
MDRRIKLLVPSLLIASCFPSYDDKYDCYETRHLIKVCQSDPLLNLPQRSDVEDWTVDVAMAFEDTKCDDVATPVNKILDAIEYTGKHGLPVVLFWEYPPLSTGRLIQASCEMGFKHELVHALLDGLFGLPWRADVHHEIMDRCDLVK